MPPVVKCLVWDLDDTLWDGVVLEGDHPRPVPRAVGTLHTLDRRGILHAVASRGHHDTAVAHLARHRLDDLFSVLEIGWGSKHEAVRRIAATLDIGLDAVAFVDNDAAELAEMARALPPVRCYPAAQLDRLPELAEFRPAFVTEEAVRRRALYRADRERRAAEQESPLPAPDFLASLDLVMTVRRARERDLARVHELTVRTHQLNTTGRTYGPDELRALCASPGHEVVVAGLRDRFGDYGTIGLAVSELTGTDTVLTLLLTSCRVLSRGAGAALLDHLVRAALAAGRRPVAHFRPTDVNRAMLVTLRFAGFAPLRQDGELLVLAVDPGRPPPDRATPVRVVRDEGSLP